MKLKTLALSLVLFLFVCMAVYFLVPEGAKIAAIVSGILGSGILVVFYFYSRFPAKEVKSVQMVVYPAEETQQDELDIEDRFKEDLHLYLSSLYAQGIDPLSKESMGNRTPGFKIRDLLD